MFKKLKDFFIEYKQLALVIISIVIGLILEIVGLHKAAHIVLGFSALANAVPLVWDMIQDLRTGTYGVDILAATAIVTSVLLGQYWAGMVIVLMLTGGEALEDYAERRAKTELTALLERAPTKAHLVKGRKTVDVAVNKLRQSDKIIIRPGEVVPVDAVIIDGSASFDESSLTGESLPQVKKAGEELLSGSINLDGAITAKALRSAEDSQFEQIIKLVKSASASKAPFVRLADRYSIPFTIAAFTIAISAWVFSGQPIRFLEVLVVATPCPLILGAPIALISGMSRAAKNGIIVKTGSSMEQLAAVKTLGFDKTGTITKGEPKVGEVKAYGKFTADQVIGYAAGLEQSSNHVLANAIIDRAKSHKIKIVKTKKIREIAGKGLLAHVQGKEVLVGRSGLMQDYGVSLPKNLKVSSIQQTAAYVAVDGNLAGVITFTDEVRPEAKQTLELLKKQGIKDFLMVTGDSQATADNIAKKVGISHIHAEALPADKLHAIDDVKLTPVGFVGDGVNDAPVLAASDVGIALGAKGSTAASESADVVILQDNIGQVANSVFIAKRTFFIAKQSILIGIIISTGLMLVFATGKFVPLWGAIIQELVDVIVIFNALRAHGPWTSAEDKLAFKLS